MLSFAIGIAVTAVVLLILSVVIPGLEIDSIGSAVIAAVVLALVATAALWTAMATGMAVTGENRGLGMWPYYAILFVTNTIALGVTSLLIDGLRVRGFVSLVAAGAVLTAVDF